MMLAGSVVVWEGGWSGGRTRAARGCRRGRQRGWCARATRARRPDRTRVTAAARGVHYLVNAAGIIRIGPILEATVQDWRDIFTINAESIFFLCQGIGPHMPAGG